ncbi:MAG: BTAD domain-containing putative transcriptional regulator [Baekduiaceae bacterium]
MKSTMNPAERPPISPDAHSLVHVLDALPFGVAVVGDDGRVARASREFDALCGPDTVGRPVTELLRPTSDAAELDLAANADDTLVRLGDGRHAALSVRALEPGALVVCVRAIDPAGVPRVPAPVGTLHVRTLGRCHLERGGGVSLDGAWLEQRAGQLLRLLIATRGQVLTTDRIADLLWPDGDAGSTTTVRYVVHTLRERLEPARKGRGASAYVVSHRGGYRLHPDLVVVDADAFERDVRDGLAAHSAGGGTLATRLLERAVGRYHGDFLIEDPYADWATAERERLRELLGRALRALAEQADAAGDLTAASDRLAHLAELEPLDVDVHRDLIELCLRRGRRGEATRRYDALRRRVESATGAGPGFALASLSGG